MSIKLRPDESVDSALRRFKREVMRSEVLTDLRKKEYFVSPSEKRRMKSAAARKKAKKYTNKNKLY